MSATAGRDTARPGRSGEPDAAPAGTGRAGRNLVAAIGVGLGLGGAVVVSLLAYRPAFGAVVTLAVLVGIVEITGAMRSVDAQPPRIPLLVGAVAIEAVTWLRGPEGLAVMLLLTVLVLAVWRLGGGSAGYLRDLSTAILVAVYVPFLAGFALLLAVPDDGFRRVIVFMATVVCSDVGGYTAGVCFGRHPMAPTVSPKKSWEGFAGSVLLCAACGAALGRWLLDLAIWQGLLFGVVIAAVATLGDLGESMLKRDLDVKDMGTLLPGHGGVMDRLDSMLPGAAVSYLLLTLFLR
ncbi:MAG: phosphatidate cytidylyltransferase [Mycobacteriales bacterium]